MDSVYKNMDYCMTEFSPLTDARCDTSIIVPDSQCDIVKVVSVKAFPTICETKPENGSVTVTGQVKFNVLYIGEEDSSRLCSLFASVPFSHSVPAFVSDNCSPMAQICSYECEYNLINSRRIKVASQMRIALTLFKNNRVSLLSEAKNAETKSKTISYLKLCAACCKNISITESADLPQGKDSIKQILSYDASVSDYSYKILNNKVILKGNVTVNLMYNSESGITNAGATVPFTEVLEVEGVSPEKELDISLNISDCDIRSDTDLKGEERMIDINLIITASITAFLRESIDAVTDLYVPKKAIECEYSPLKTYTTLKCCREEEFVKETVCVGSISAPISKVIDTRTDICTVTFDKTTSLITIAGSVTVLYCTSDSSAVNSYTGKITVSHKTAFINPENITSSIKHSGFVISGENTVELRLSILISAICKETIDLRCVSHCIETDYTPEKRASVIVSFVNEPLSLWDVAKKYNVSLKALSSANNLDENSPLSKGTRLIIPR